MIKNFMKTFMNEGIKSQRKKKKNAVINTVSEN